MPQSEARELFHHLLRSTVHLHRHLHDLLRNEEEASGGLLEEILPGGSQLKEPLIHIAAIVGQSLLREVHEEALDGLLLCPRLAQLRSEQPLHVLPEPIPGHFMLRVPIFGHEGPQGSQHDGLELGEVYLTLALGKIQRENVAFLLQAVGVGYIGHNWIEVLQDELHPVAICVAHHRSIEEEHFIEGRRHLERRGFRRSLLPLLGLRELVCSFGFLWYLFLLFLLIRLAVQVLYHFYICSFLGSSIPTSLQDSNPPCVLSPAMNVRAACIGHHCRQA
mmetsp:Transcript_41502/g.96991  ORF Transcript_41502/g.96991 Transcript_41502/m.96991 type:complete len:277 (-) Transcript_41502:579-1409(-)